ALFFFLGRWCWSRSAYCCLRYPAPQVAALAAIAGAVIYSALAGFSIPTQRTVIMIVVVMLGVIMRHRGAIGETLALALLLVLLWDPFATLAPGFWLSFGAVALLIYGMSGRLNQNTLWWRWGRAQWLMAVGLAPLLLLFFQKSSVTAPLANLVAVPWVSLLVVPLVLVGTLLLPWVPFIGEGLLRLADLLLQLIWYGLTLLADPAWSQWSPSALPGWSIVAAVMGVILLLAPRGLPLRYLGLLWLLPLWLLKPGAPQQGEVWFTLLDVGQGLSAVVRTQHHTLVYDTGPGLGREFNAGSTVLLPFLQYEGVRAVDRLIIGHGDADHIGGARALTEGIAVEEVLTSVPAQVDWMSSQFCDAGRTWQWDGVTFELLHPRQHDGLHHNNHSCVVRIEGEQGSILITGDIEKEAEHRLVREQAERLKSDILVVPHHGSATSSTESFIEAVRPQFALFPLGYRNRYGHPKARVVERYRQRGIVMLDTATAGAISFRLSKKEVLRPKSFRATSRYYWHRKE
ncbi:MAG: competence protein ComEC, partial [Halothiobacillaceae bacterium]